MKCKECQKKITFDHYVATNRSDSNTNKIQLVLTCDCGIYMIPFELVQIGNGIGLISSEEMKYWKIDEDRVIDGKKLSREGQRIYNKQGKQAYEKWKNEVFWPLVDARIKKLRTSPSK